jgi:hypothetical protein
MGIASSPSLTGKGPGVRPVSLSMDLSPITSAGLREGRGRNSPTPPVPSSPPLRSGIYDLGKWVMHIRNAWSAASGRINSPLLKAKSASADSSPSLVEPAQTGFAESSDGCPTVICGKTASAINAHHPFAKGREREGSVCRATMQQPRHKCSSTPGFVPRADAHLLLRSRYSFNTMALLCSVSRAL